MMSLFCLSFTSTIGRSVRVGEKMCLPTEIVMQQAYDFSIPRIHLCKGGFHVVQPTLGTPGLHLETHVPCNQLSSPFALREVGRTSKALYQKLGKILGSHCFVTISKYFPEPDLRVCKRKLVESSHQHSDGFLTTKFLEKTRRTKDGRVDTNGLFGLQRSPKLVSRFVRDHETRDNGRDSTGTHGKFRKPRLVVVHKDSNCASFCCIQHLVNQGTLSAAYQYCTSCCHNR
mmetsp:Transcript_53292/g.105969  ORF Transcript_53292/g.105969 Transcript_53292/m.105969 type:complete len:230 (-) Transcript_53292:222-911(-)